MEVGVLSTGVAKFGFKQALQEVEDKSYCKAVLAKIMAKQYGT